MNKQHFLNILNKSILSLTLIGGTAMMGCQASVNYDPSLEAQVNDAAGGSPSQAALEVSFSELDQAEDVFTKGNFTLSPKFSHLDPGKIIPRPAFEKAMDFFQKYQSKFKNQNYIGIIDFKTKNTNKRFYLVNLKTGAVERYLVAHGKYSDSDFDGYATSFSNVNGTGKSSLGAYMTAETYYGKHGKSMRLDGLQSTNSNARSRAIVMHSASYVSPNRSPIGRSLGCPAVESRYLPRLMTALSAGALLYANY